jgi:hypothetical protein
VAQFDAPLRVSSEEAETNHIHTKKARIIGSNNHEARSRNSCCGGGGGGGSIIYCESVSVLLS